MTARASRGDLLFVKGLIEAGEVRAVIDRSYPLAEVAEAIRYLETDTPGEGGHHGGT